MVVSRLPQRQGLAYHPAMSRKLFACLAVAFAGATPQRAGAQAPAGLSAIDTTAIRAYTYFLADDLLEGRGTGRRGDDIAALYIAAQAERIGLRGAGGGGGYRLSVPLVEAEIDSVRTALRLTVEPGAGVTGGSRLVPYRSGFIPNVGTAHTLVAFAGELVYFGSAHDVLAHPGRVPPMGGRVAVLRGMFGGEAAAADTLRSRGAAGVVHLVGDRETYALFVQDRGASRLYGEGDALSSFVPAIPAVIASPALERQILEGIAEPDEAVPLVLAGRRVEVAIGVQARSFTGYNVAAWLPGADSALQGEFVVYTAHHDHLGFSTPDERGDSIYNGFSDNAAGCAMLLAIADAMARGPRPARSVLFLWFTGEERGLLGSEYYAAHPAIALTRLAAVINLDAGAPAARSVQWRISGGDFSTLGQAAIDVAQRNGWQATSAPASPNSDYFPFLRLGVPAVSLVPGPGAYEGMTTEASRALFRRWDRYHQAGDGWFPGFPSSGLLRFADFAYQLGMSVGAGARPTMIR
jgi:hypothetical protein